ncbi:MAG: hypothetical protein ILP23_05730 [Paludibacteraceae bacterium]|nr:hypothetical protein [Paludibacteraceae bacterium]
MPLMLLLTSCEYDEEYVRIYNNASVDIVVSVSPVSVDEPTILVRPGDYVKIDVTNAVLSGRYGDLYTYLHYRYVDDRRHVYDYDIDVRGYITDVYIDDEGFSVE